MYERQGVPGRALAKFRQAAQIQSNERIDVDWSKKLMGDLLLEMSRLAEAEQYIAEAGYDSSQLATSCQITTANRQEGL